MKSMSESIHDERFVDALLNAPIVDAIPVDKIFMTRFTIDKNTHVPEAIFLLDGKEYPVKFDPVDIIEVIHGHNTYDHNSAFECSICGFSDWDTMTADCGKYNYCPNCGARMDGGN